ncbi:MAG: hypothetical protein JW860_01890 [Sedimentisphaerales bacterium]|nr:hypothetical protein [Sedimentisphaerales bacterium]
MSRINTNIASMNAMHKLIANNDDLTTRIQRLSSGLRINVGKDDPAGLIGSENLRSEMAGLRSAINNSIRASSVIATAEGALNEISALLIDIKELLVTSANKGALSDEEIDANQLQVDSAISSIQRIANATEFEGIKLLNGNRAYTTSAVSSGFISELNINAAKLIDGATMGVTVTVTSAADTGQVYISTNASLKLSAALSIRVGSNRGTTDLTFAACASLTNVIYGINQVREITGVSAALSTDGAQGWARLRSVDFGTDAYVSVKTLNVQGTMTGTVINTSVAGTNNTDAKDYGVDARANINGTSAIAKGKNLTIRTNMVDAEIELTAAIALSTTDQTTLFGITAGGSDFAIGARVDAIGLESVGIESVAPSQLGHPDDGYLHTLKSGQTNALSGDNLYTAQRIVDYAIKDISTLRGRLGAFQKNVLETNINSLRVTLENVTASESAIRDTDFANETAALTRSQILVQANTSVLSIANSLPQSVLALLG